MICALFHRELPQVWWYFLRLAKGFQNQVSGIGLDGKFAVQHRVARLTGSPIPASGVGETGTMPMKLVNPASVKAM